MAAKARETEGWRKFERGSWLTWQESVSIISYQVVILLSQISAKLRKCCNFMYDVPWRFNECLWMLWKALGRDKAAYKSPVLWSLWNPLRNCSHQVLIHGIKWQMGIQYSFVMPVSIAYRLLHLHGQVNWEKTWVLKIKKDELQTNIT